MSGDKNALKALLAKDCCKGRVGNVQKEEGGGGRTNETMLIFVSGNAIA